MDTFINFNNDDENNTVSSKLNMDELFVKKQQQSLNVLNNYNKILTRIHNKIKFTSRQQINDECCWFVVPEFIIGIPKYDHRECIAYVIDKLRDNGFIVRYTHPNLIFISWKQWIPTYVRNEIKKTGKDLDEYGNLKHDKNENENNNESNNNINSSIFNNKLDLSKTNSSNNSKKNLNFKDVNSYKPSGLIYSENLLKKLNI